ncbi:glucose-6-phosphate isomerase [Methanothermococcus sp. SCGC AD-155-M21]|nr:glucose-6-phosphate isomerase [Methanothermococcus sp. SCGC AD-155-M21]
MISYFDYKNTTEEKIGNEGISLRDVEAMSDTINKAYNGVINKYKNKELGFMDVIYDEDLNKYYELSKYYKDYEYIVIIGMGGSILGTQMVYEGIHGIYYNELNSNSKKVYFLDNSDPEKLYDILKIVDLKKTLLFVISKSGNTVETLANFFIIKEKMDRIGCSNNIIIISSGGILKNIAEKEGYMLFDVPENVGGRFSVLSSVGLAPMSCMGIDIKGLIEGARDMDKLCKNEDVFKNPALMNALIHYIFLNRGKSISVLMPYIERLHKFGIWYRQLWAESLGKDGKGQTPVISIGAKDQHSQLQLYLDGPKDKIITFLKVKKFKEDFIIKYQNHYLNNHKLSKLINFEQLGTEGALTSKGIPNISIVLEELNEYSLGKLIYMYEIGTAFMGEMMGINTFNQPAVEEGKIITRKLLEGKSIENMMKNKLNEKYLIEM